jgi:hypothetical protein
MFEYNYVDERYEDWLSDQRDAEEREQWLYHLFQIQNYVWHKNLKRELIETLYHPDRYEKMTKRYGEIWADIHLP